MIIVIHPFYFIRKYLCTMINIIPMEHFLMSLIPIIKLMWSYKYIYWCEYELHVVHCSMMIWCRRNKILNKNLLTFHNCPQVKMHYIGHHNIPKVHIEIVARTSTLYQIKNILFYYSSIRLKYWHALVNAHSLMVFKRASCNKSSNNLW